MEKKKAIITGIAGQDGSYLAELLLEKDYEVYGVELRSDAKTLKRIKHILNDVIMVDDDLLSLESVDRIINVVAPHEVYNLAGPSLIPETWENPVASAKILAVSVTRLLEAIRRFSPETKYYQASTSQLFGAPLQSPQDEKTPFNPCNPYGIAKLYAHQMVKTYREKYNMFACSGILFAHESPRRPVDHFSRRITNAAACIKQGIDTELKLGNLDYISDWGYSPDYVKAMWLMLNHSEPSDFIISSGEPHTLREFVQEAFDYLDLNWKDHVVEDKTLYAAMDGASLVGNSKKAREVLKWEPEVDFKSLVKIMVDHDMEEVKKDIDRQVIE